MPIINTVKGNLITLADTKRYSAVVQGNNCHCVWGAGLAPQMKKRWPDAWKKDMMTERGSKAKLGRITSHYDETIDTYVINAYTQFDTVGRYQNPPVHDVSYDAIFNCFRLLNNVTMLRTSGKPVGIPMIGAGLAGGDWGIISRLISLATPDINIELVIYDD